MESSCFVCAVWWSDSNKSGEWCLVWWKFGAPDKSLVSSGGGETTDLITESSLPAAACIWILENDRKKKALHETFQHNVFKKTLSHVKTSSEPLTHQHWLKYLSIVSPFSISASSRGGYWPSCRRPQRSWQREHCCRTVEKRRLAMQVIWSTPRLVAQSVSQPPKGLTEAMNID